MIRGDRASEPRRVSFGPRAVKPPQKPSDDLDDA
jgi:hypothetical protein